MPALVAGHGLLFSPRDSLSRARTLRLRVEISAEDAAPEVLLGCSPLCARFSEFALTKAIVVA
jgi:hypothetical protein